MNTLVATIALLLVVAPAAAQTAAKPRPNAGRPASKSEDPRAMLRAFEDAFTSVADRVTPAVVNVSGVPDRNAAPSGGEGEERFREYFGDELYERYFRRRPREDGRRG